MCCIYIKKCVEIKITVIVCSNVRTIMVMSTFLLILKSILLYCLFKNITDLMQQQGAVIIHI